MRDNGTDVATLQKEQPNWAWEKTVVLKSTHKCPRTTALLLESAGWRQKKSKRLDLQNFQANVTFKDYRSARLGSDVKPYICVGWAYAKSFFSVAGMERECPE